MTRKHTVPPGVDEQWVAFAEQDAQVRAPAHLEARVMEAVRRRRTPPRWRVKRPWLFAGAGALAAAAAVLFALRPTERTPIPSRPLPATAVMAAYSAPVTPRPHEVAADVSTLRAVRTPLPPPIVKFALGAPHETEVLQLVRLRLPREALRAFGLGLLAAHDTGQVDVDVLVGEDGLPRDIRSIRSVQE